MREDKRFNVSREVKDDRVVLTLEGEINERTDLGGIFENLERDRIVINLRGIDRINSVGVRDWVNASKPLADSYNVEYEECSVFVIHQLNMIANFLSYGKIISFYAPYYCDDCDHEHRMLVVVDEHFRRSADSEEPEAPEFDCPDCGAKMKLNHDEEKYFYFLGKKV